jgi:glycine/D-amino acid oxidase-like deaminating enzyme
MEFDVIVVGAGAIGGAIAYELASRGVTVCRAGEIERSNSASKAAGAMNGCFGEVTNSLLNSEHGRLKLEMDVLAKNMWPEWLRRLAVSSNDDSNLLSAAGTHVILNSAGMAEIDSVNYNSIKLALAEYSESYEDVEPCDIEWLKPDDLVRPLCGLHIPHEHAINSHLLLHKLDEGLKGEGGAICPVNVRRLIVDNGSVVGVELVNGRSVFAEKVVLAAGVHTLSLLEQFPEIHKKIPPLFNGYGVSLLVKVSDKCGLPTSVIRTPNRAFACGLHCVPRGDGLLYIGATNILAETPKSNALISDVQFLLGCAVEQLHLDLHDAEIISVQVGNRPISADGFPLLGEVGVGGVWIATGTYRDGLHQSPLIARYIADALSGSNNMGLDLKGFCPVRPPLSGISRKLVVKETVRQMFATGYEYRWNIKPYWLPLIDEGLSRNYQKLIDDLHAEFTPPPELIAFSYLYKSMREKLAAYYGAWK